MDYVPLKGRWATLALIAVIAFGATVLCLRIDGYFPDGEEIELGSRGRGNEGASVASEQVIVVNPDGSIRKDSGAETKEEDLQGGGAPEAEVNEFAVAEGSAQQEADADWNMGESQGKSPPGGRIE